MPASVEPRVDRRHPLSGFSLISVAGLVGRPVRSRNGSLVGHLEDVVVRSGGLHPAAVGIVVRIGQRHSWLHAQDIAGLDQGELVLTRVRFDLQDVVRRPGEIQLVGDLLDHQLVDVRDVRVVRASDLYLALVEGVWRLVGVDVSWLTFVRRALPGSRWRNPSPKRVLDWAEIHSLEVSDEGPVRLQAPSRSLATLTASDLAGLVAQLGRSERHKLLGGLSVDDAADVLEVLPDADVSALLSEAVPGRAADLLGSMEPDEAVDALRELDSDDRERLLREMGRDAVELRTLLGFDEDTAGGMMTSDLVLVDSRASIGDVVGALTSARSDGTSDDLVVLVDESGALVDDVSAAELIGQARDRPVSELVGPPFPVTVAADDDLAAVVTAFRDNRGSSVLVIDRKRVPLGRILADDVIDALARGVERRWPWQGGQVGPR